MRNIKAGQIWIRRNKNVRVRVWREPRNNEVFFEYKGNCHSRSMNLDQFLREFVCIESLVDITEGSEWISRKDNYLSKAHKVFVVCDVREKQGLVIYNIKNGLGNGRFQIEIGRFKDKFIKHRGEQA
ncbi:hypothetical protein Q8P09_12320 [Psychrobacter faecalis]|uniref:Uncharacterized protein n=1 Tax=Psychrobacter faecalis TaxID=180588 RepID=A0ABT9HJ94_9GAMM|nr:hypothetical protein [Psychrobacter faecalis]MDP4545860.1 hypothetical protein [Psychrobacter faecalis]